MVRRLKGELRKHVGSQIPERKTIQIDLQDLPADTPELVLAEKLAGRPRTMRAPASCSRR